MSTANAPGPTIEWYRCPVDRQTLRAVNARSNALGLAQTLGFLGVLLLTGGLAWYSSGHWNIGLTLALIFLHGMGYAFAINAVHELGHKTVFAWRWANTFFEHLFAFMAWMNHRMFWESHLRHHRYTLHPPDDLEVILPAKITLRGYILARLVNPIGFWGSLRYMIRVACGRFQGEWELKLFPPENPALRRWASNWARTLLAGHLLILATAIYFKLWILPVLTTFAAFYGNWLQSLCNDVQHAGLCDKVPDFRLCCRTVHLNPILRFMYWHMNYHTEHHMYPGVPCYRLGQLHRAIRDDLPPTVGLLGAWKQIVAALRAQEKDPGYQFLQPLPTKAPATTAVQAQ